MVSRAENSLKDAALLIFANKKDCSGALPLNEISEMLELGRIEETKYAVFDSCALSGDGVWEGLGWLVKNI